MKNLIKFSAILLTASIFFSSCESNLSITKRHYTSGFYVDYSKSNKVITPDKANQPVAAAPVVVAREPVVANSPMANIEQPVKAKGPGAIVAIKKMLPKINLLPIAKQDRANSFGAIMAPAGETNNVLSESPKMNTGISDDDRGEHAALSLLWLVIVIVLILWLIGLLAGGFGLGGLINLLLVIALILLVLWLLRII
jgi:hypothetical protein